MVPLSSHKISRVSWYSFMPDIFAFDYRTVTFFGPPSQVVCLAIFSFCMLGRLSRSLAATWDIEFSFFSSGYLDVSVHPVRFFRLCIGIKIPFSWWVAPFGDLWFDGYLLLPTAFRSLSRPSSPLGA